MSLQSPLTEDTSPPAPRVVVVMGVSRCGKSTVGALLALHLRWEFEVNGTFVGGCDIVREMHETGEFAELIAGVEKQLVS